MTMAKTMARKLNVANKAYALCDAACKVDWDQMNEEQVADKVIELVSGNGDLFMLIDQSPHVYGPIKFSSDVFCHFRRTRNHPIHGKRLFASFKK